jgi:CpeS-like protein
MDIQEFFGLSAGKWFSQRTSNDLVSNRAENGKSDLVIELISKDEPALLSLCQEHGIDTSLAWGGIRVSWNNLTAVKPAKKVGSCLLVPIADPQRSQSGKLLRDGAAAIGHYSMGKDKALTLITEEENLYSEERLWFVSPNLRLRTSIIKRDNGFSMTSFCSEIRMLSAPK